MMAQRSDEPRVSDNIPLKVVTPEVMQRIRDVVRDTVTPSWISSVPYNFGDASAGTLKADEWRTMSTIYIPLALVSMWGEGTSHSSPDVGIMLRRILDHTMALVCAITIACLRTTTEARALAYRTFVATYIHDLQDILPEATRRTNQHMAMHIYDFMRLFGPVHSWWCFPFERLIGQLQRMTNNHKIGMCSILLSAIIIYTPAQESWRPACSIHSSKRESLDVGSQERTAHQ